MGRGVQPDGIVDRMLRGLGRALPLNPLSDRVYRAVVPALDLLPDGPAVVPAAGHQFRVFHDRPRALENSPDFYLYYFGTWEPRLARALRRLLKSGDTCADVGANVGWYTLLLSALVGPGGRVFSFEPDPRAFAHLVENLSLNPGAQNVLLEPAAVGATVGEARLYLGDSDLYSSLFVKSERTVHVAPRVTLDNYLFDRGVGNLEFVKCDAEGAELEVFRGAKATLGRDRPPILQLEVNPETAGAAGFHPRELLDWLAEAYGYHFYAVNRMGWLVHKPVEAVADTLSDVLALVPERHGDRLVQALA